MLSLAQLWLPVVVSAVAVFFASFMLHMVLKWHKADYKPLPNEEEVRAALRSSANAPAQYMVPYVADPKTFKDTAVAQKFIDGPLALIAIRKPGPPAMGPFLGQWFALNVLVAVIAGYLESKTVPASASFLAICRPVSLVTFMAYGMGSIIDSIWLGRPWSNTVRDLIDAFIYGLITALAFAFLWPHAA